MRPLKLRYRIRSLDFLTTKKAVTVNDNCLTCDDVVINLYGYGITINLHIQDIFLIASYSYQHLLHFPSPLFFASASVTSDALSGFIRPQLLME